MIKIPTLTRNDSNVIKGLCMLLIMFHNFFHLIEPRTGENEFAFDPENFNRFIDFSISDPLNIIRWLSSYFGHYGVQLFIFISSYGLYLSYKDRMPDWWNFMKKRISKLYPTLIIGIFLIFVIIVFEGRGLPSGHQVKIGLLKLTLIYNFIPDQALTFSGPWWFFSVIVQLYAVFPILVRIVKGYGPNSMLLTALVFILISMAIDLQFPTDPPDTFSVFFTFIGQLPVFSLGVYFASRREVKVGFPVLIAALLIFAFANVNQYVWYFSFVSVTVLLLAIIVAIIPLLKRFPKLNSFIIFTGSISLFLFVIHGSLRNPFVAIAEKYQNPFLTVALGFAFVALSYLFALLVRVVEKQVQEFIHSGYNVKALLARVKANDF